MDLFGLDIGTQTIKLVQLKKVNNQFQLIAFGSTPSVPRGLASDAESDLTQLAEVIKRLHQQAQVATKNVATALPEDKVFSQVISLPKLSEEELTDALKWEAEQYIPIPLDKVTLAHQIIGEVKEGVEEKIQVLLVAAPNNLVDKLTKTLKIAGLNPVSIETEVLAIARSLAGPESETFLIVDLGALATDIAILEKGQVIFTRSIPTAGEALTRAVVSGLGLEMTQAEEYKKAYGLDPKKLEGKLSETIAPVLEVIIKEIGQAIEFYRERVGNRIENEAQGKVKMISRVILVGGTALLPEIVSFFAKRLGIETQIGDPLLKIIKDGLVAKIPKNDLPFYTVALGLAMKEI